MDNIKNIDSILEVKASGSLDITEDLNQPQGKSIAELIDEQDKQDKTSQRSI